MTSPLLHLSPLALLLPALNGALPPGPAFLGDHTVRAAPEADTPALGLRAGEANAPLRVLEDALQPPEQNQVRIESRIIIRVSPSPPAQRERMLASLPRRPINTSFAEVEHGECVPIENIAGVQPADEHRLLLFLRDRRILTAALERACSARAFYSGFYVEANEDGKLCVARDRLQSRTGASCQVDTLKRLVAVRD